MPDMDGGIKKEDTLIDIILSAETPTREENLQMVKKAKQGDAKSLEDIVIRNGKLVVKELRKYSWCKDVYEDLLQEGLMGIGKAVDKFDFDYDTAFSTYAIYWIRQYIHNYFVRKTDIIYYPGEIRQNAAKLNKINERLASEGKPELTNKEIIEELQLKDDSDVVAIKSCIASTLSIDADAGEFGDASIKETIASSEISIEDNYVQKDSNEFLLKVMKKCLNDKEYDIMLMHYGIAPYSKRYRFDEIGHKYSVTKQRIEQIHGKAIRKLRDPRYLNCLKDCDIIV